MTEILQIDSVGDIRYCALEPTANLLTAYENFSPYSEPDVAN